MGQFCCSNNVGVAVGAGYSVWVGLDVQTLEVDGLLLISNCILENMSMVLLSSSWQSLVSCPDQRSPPRRTVWRTKSNFWGLSAEQ